MVSPYRQSPVASCLSHICALRNMSLLKTTVFHLTHRARAKPLHLCVYVWEREISRLSVLSGEVSVPRHFIQHRIHSQRIVSAMWCLGFQRVFIALFFSSHSISLAWLTSQQSSLFTCKIKHSHLRPSSLSPSSVFFYDNKILSVFFFFFFFRVTSKMSMKTRSQLFLRTSKFALYVNLSCVACIMITREKFSL